jgi:hypothetical protein
MFWGRKVLGFFSAYFAYYLTLDPCGLLMKKRLTNVLLISNFFFLSNRKGFFSGQPKQKLALFFGILLRISKNLTNKLQQANKKWRQDDEALLIKKSFFLLLRNFLWPEKKKLVPFCLQLVLFFTSLCGQKLPIPRPVPTNSFFLCFFFPRAKRNKKRKVRFNMCSFEMTRAFE